MSKPVLKYAVTFFGCCITTDGKREFIRRLGTDNVREFRNATEADVAYVRSMNGRVPDGRIVRAALSKALGE